MLAYLIVCLARSYIKTSGGQLLHCLTNIFFSPYSLGQESEEVVTFFVDGIDSAVCVQDAQGAFLPVQFSPTWTTEGFIKLEKHFMEGSFLAKLPPLSITKFTISLCSHK